MTRKIDVLPVLVPLQIRYPQLANPLNTLEDCVRFLQWLVDSDNVFHLEDDPADIARDGEPLFLPDEAFLVRRRVAELYKMNWKFLDYECPIGYLLDLKKSEDRKSRLEAGLGPVAPAGTWIREQLLAIRGAESSAEAKRLGLCLQAELSRRGILEILWSHDPR